MARDRDRNGFKVEVEAVGHGKRRVTRHWQSDDVYGKGDIKGDRGDRG